MTFVNHIETNPHARIVSQYVSLNSGLWSNLLRKTVTEKLFIIQQRRSVGGGSMNKKKISKCKLHGP